MEKIWINACTAASILNMSKTRLALEVDLEVKRIGAGIGHRRYNLFEILRRAGIESKLIKKPAQRELDFELPIKVKEQI